VDANPAVKCSDEQLHSLLDLARKGDPVARDMLVRANKGLVISISGRFRRIAGGEYEDILQVGYVGLLKAIDGFDPGRGTKFSTYAFPLIMGEIRRYLRDSGLLHVDRTVRESSRRIARAREALVSRLGREATLREVALEAGMEVDEVVSSMEASAPLCYLDESGCDLLQAGTDDPGERMIEELALAHAMNGLEPRERTLISLRYGLGLTQAAIASRLGISQAQVSRQEKSALERLKRLM